MPKGVFNLVNGDGADVGEALSAHPDVDMVSFTGSTRAGIRRRQGRGRPRSSASPRSSAASRPTSCCPTSTLAAAVAKGVDSMCNNSGQSCNAPTRMFVPADRARRGGGDRQGGGRAIVVGDPRSAETTARPGGQPGPVRQDPAPDRGRHRRGRRAGGRRPRPARGPQRGYYVRPTVFADVTNDMTIAREEIFGPVLVDPALRGRGRGDPIANDTIYGLAAYVQSGDIERARKVASQMRAGNVHINAPAGDTRAVRRLQAVGQRPRMRQVGPRGVPRDQGRDRLPSR